MNETRVDDDMAQHSSDPDLAAVLGATDRSAGTFASVLRFTAKSGNHLAQLQAIYHVADMLDNGTITYAEDLVLDQLSPDELAFCTEIEETVAAADRGPKKRRTTPKAQDTMEGYMKKPTKIRRTFQKFYDRYGSGKAPRASLTDMMKNDPELIHHSSTNKLFQPPPGFEQALFSRDGSEVYLAPAWVDAWKIASV